MASTSVGSMVRMWLASTTDTVCDSAAMPAVAAAKQNSAARDQETPPPGSNTTRARTSASAGKPARLRVRVRLCSPRPGLRPRAPMRCATHWYSGWVRKNADSLLSASRMVRLRWMSSWLRFTTPMYPSASGITSPLM